MRKASDVVGIDSIMRAVANLGINGKLFEWIRIYIQNRIHYVKLSTSTNPVPLAFIQEFHSVAAFCHGYEQIVHSIVRQ